MSFLFLLYLKIDPNFISFDFIFYNTFSFNCKRCHSLNLHNFPLSCSSWQFNWGKRDDRLYVRFHLLATFSVFLKTRNLTVNHNIIRKPPVLYSSARKYFIS